MRLEVHQSLSFGSTQDSHLHYAIHLTQQAAWNPTNSSGAIRKEVQLRNAMTVIGLSNHEGACDPSSTLYTDQMTGVGASSVGTDGALTFPAPAAALKVSPVL